MRALTSPLASATRRAQSLAQTPRLRFCLLFGAALGTMMASFELWQEPFSQLYLRPVCEVAAATLNGLGVTAHLDTSTTLQGFCTMAMARITFRVIHECTGIFTLLIYLAAVLAYPATPKDRLAGVLGGTTAFFLYSSVRLVLLGVVGHLNPSWIPHAHAWLMVLMNLGFALFLWLWWAERVGPHGRH